MDFREIEGNDAIILMQVKMQALTKLLISKGILQKKKYKNNMN